MTRWWPAGTDWPSRRWPTPGPSWTGRSWWTPRNGSPPIWSACTGGRAGDGPGRLTRVSHGGVPRGIGGLLEDYAFCAEGLFSLYGVTGRTRWYDLAGAMLDAACERFAADGGLKDAAGESAQVTAAQGGRNGLDPFDNADPQRSRRPGRGPADPLGPVRLLGTPHPGGQHPLAAASARGPGAPRGRLAARDRTGRARRTGRGRRRRTGHAGTGGAPPRAAALGQSGAGGGGPGRTAPPGPCRCCAAAAPLRTAPRRCSCAAAWSATLRRVPSRGCASAWLGWLR